MPNSSKVQSQNITGYIPTVPRQLTLSVSILYFRVANVKSTSEFQTTYTMHMKSQWRSQNRIVARAQVGHIYNAAQHAKVSVRKHALLGGLGACPPGTFWNLEPPRSHLVFSGRVSVAKIRIPMQYSGSTLVAIQPSRKLL